MKIDYVLVGSTQDNMYLDFWPIISKVWKKRFNITPVLGLICDEHSDFYDDGNGLVKKFKKINGVSEGLQSQVVRLYLTNFLNGNCLISDIDMIPISRKYFIDDVEVYDDEDFIIFSSHHPGTQTNNEYPMCYILGNNKTYKSIFEMPIMWEHFLSSLPSFGWATDQKYIYERINSSNYKKLKFPFRNFMEKNRIDRIDWNYNYKLLNDNIYIDCHSLRPYSSYKNQIDLLVENLLL